MKRTLYLLLSALVLAAAVSCGDASEDTSVTTTAAVNGDNAAVTEEETEASLLDDLGEKDLGGMGYTIFDCNAHVALHVNIPGEEMSGDVVNDALLKRDNFLEDKYNCQIKYFQENAIGKLKTMVSAGDDEWQLIINPMTSLNTQATSGYLANMCDMPYMEMDKEWWNPLMYDNMRLFDAMYFTSSDIAPGIYQMPTCLFLNLKLYADYDFEFDIYQSVLDGTWTMEQMHTMTQGMDSDLNGDNKWTVYDDFFGFASHNSSEAVLTMLIGCGVKMSQIDDKGENVTCNLIKDSHAMSVIEGISPMFKEVTYTDDINDYTNILFEENRAMFLMHKLESAATHLRDMEEDYLILPSPKWDEAQEDYYSFLSPHGSCFIGLPQTVSGNENYGFLTEALARYSHQYVRPIAYDLVYKEKDSRDERTVAILDILLDGLYIDYQSLYNFGSLNDQLTSIFFKDAPIVSTIEKRQKTVDKTIAKMVENWIPVE